MNKFYVYQLIDPRNDRPFYIGKGIGRRMFVHVRDVTNGKIPNGNNYLFNKIKRILSFGYNIDYRKVSENLSEQDAFNIERGEIFKYGKRGSGILCNLTDGGEGVVGHTRTPEQIRKHRVSLKKRFADSHFLAEHRRRMKIVHSSPNAKQKNSEAITKFYKTHPEQKEKLSDIQTKLWAAGKYDNSKSWEFTSPNGNIFKFNNLNEHCRKYNLTQSNMISVSKGLRTHHKGWKRVV